MQPDAGKRLVFFSSNSPLRQVPFYASANCIIGVKGHERTCPQEIFIEGEVLVTKEVDHKHIDRVIKNIIFQYLAEEKPKLIERMAYALGRRILLAVNKATAITLTLKKPRALHKAKNAFVTVELRRQNLEHGDVL